MAGKVAAQLWEEWQSGSTDADVFNVNVPLGFKTVDGSPVNPEVLRTTVDMQSQYSSLYSKSLCFKCLCLATWYRYVASTNCWYQKRHEFSQRITACKPPRHWQNVQYAK